MYEYVTRNAEFVVSSLSTLAAPSEANLDVGVPSVDLQGYVYIPTNRGVVSLDVQGELRWRFIPTPKIVLKKSSLIPSSVTSEDETQQEDDNDNVNYDERRDSEGEEETETILVKGSLLTLHPPVLNEQDQVAYLPTLSKEIYTLNLRDGQLYSLPTPLDSVILPSKEEEGKFKPFGSETQVLSYHPSKRILFAGGRTLATFRLDRDGRLITPKSSSSSSDLFSSHFNSVRAPIAVEEKSIYFVSSRFRKAAPSSSSSSSSSSLDSFLSSSVRRRNCQLEARSVTFPSSGSSSSSSSTTKEKKQRRIS
jgi:hypothetical protein